MLYKGSLKIVYYKLEYCIKLERRLMMNGFWLLIPFVLIRFVLLGLLDKRAIKRAAFFPPLIGKERLMYVIYQITNVLMILYLFFLHVEIAFPIFYIGLIAYLLGLIICAMAIINFAKPKHNGINLDGLYKWSRNPMYVGYFFYYLGCALLTQSIIYLILLMGFQLATHWIILSEERWCIKQFGEEYRHYMKTVRRYF